MRCPASLIWWMILIFWPGLSFHLVAQDEIPKIIAKVSFIKGKALWATSIDGPYHPIIKGQTIFQGLFVKTQKASILKVKFIDKTQIILGPNSISKINFLRGKEIGVVGLVSGQLRSIVKKEENIKKKNKLIITTKGAAMGVRGTDFQVHSKGGEANLYVSTGSVAFSPIRKEPSELKEIDKVLFSKKAIFVSEGEFSQILNGRLKVYPLKIPVAKIKTWSVKDPPIISMVTEPMKATDPIIELVRGLNSNAKENNEGVRQRGEREVEMYRQRLVEWEKEME